VPWCFILPTRHPRRFCRFQARRFYGILVGVIVENDNRFHLAATSTAAKRLSEIPLNQRCRIERLEGPGEDCDRLLDLGFTPGEEVIVTHTAPLGDPIVIRVRGALLALRKREAAWILVE
jgi:ferrous iron transport protein A